jgi:hypothetical protein
MANLTRFFILLFLPCFSAFSQDTSRLISSDVQMLSSDQIHLNTRMDTKDPKRIILDWSCSPLESQQFFTIERSKNGNNFDVIGVIKGNKGQSLFEFTDEKPAHSNNFYRIKTVFSEDVPVYSKIVSKGVSIAQFFKFYPNPVEKYLIVRTESPIELKITDPLNKVRISKQLEVGLQLVDVNSLEKGLYIITVFQKESNRLITDKLIKN